MTDDLIKCIQHVSVLRNVNIGRVVYVQVVFKSRCVMCADTERDWVHRVIFLLPCFS